jgi:hypothetical protein
MRESDLRFKQTLQDERVTTSKVLIDMKRQVKNHSFANSSPLR